MFRIIFGNNFEYNAIAITAPFYVKINDFCFPDEQWDDFILSVLDMWCRNVIDAYNSTKHEFDLHFIDGSFIIHCAKEGSILKMVCAEGYIDEELIVFSCDMEFKQFVAELIGVSDNFIKALNNKFKKRPDKLYVLIKQFKKFKKRIRTLYGLAEG